MSTSSGSMSHYFSIVYLQVSTSSGSMSHYYNLEVIVPRAYILGSEEYYAQTGAAISLVCIIEDVSPSTVSLSVKTFYMLQASSIEGLPNLTF